MSSPKCPLCGGVLMPKVMHGMALYKEGADGRRIYDTKCMACGELSTVSLKHCFPALKGTPFQTGRKWLCTSSSGRARFWFIILGPGSNYAGVPSKAHKRCRLEVHPDDLRNKLPGYKAHGSVSTYSHAHLKKYAVLEPLV